jgi:hypothetical protein
MHRSVMLLLAAACVLQPPLASAQGLTGALIGTVKDGQGGVLAGAVVRVSSSALIGGPATLTTDEDGRLRFPALPPGRYRLDIQSQGFTTYHEEDILIGAGATIERTASLTLAGLAESVVVEGAGSRVEARDPGIQTRVGPEDLSTIPTRRSSMFDAIRAAPGISPTSPGSGTATTVSAFGSATNENLFLIDGTNFTCPCNGTARAEPGIDFIQEVHVQSMAASAEFGSVQGAVINVVTRQGSERFLYDASYWGQTAGLTGQPVRRAIPGGGGLQSGYERERYRDFTTSVGGPAIRDRLWFFTGYQHLRDYDSQPGASPAFPRTYEQDKIFAKLTWKLAQGWQLLQSLHDEFWVNPELATMVKPFEATTRSHASVPAITIGDLRHVSSSSTLWEARLGRFVYSREDEPSSANRMISSRFDQATNVSSGAPPTFGGSNIIRTTAKVTVSHFRSGLWAADHHWKLGAQFDRGDHHVSAVIPTGVRFVDNGGRPFQSISRPPSQEGGVSVTASAFVTDTVTTGVLTISAGLRFDHSRAIVQDLRALDPEGRETDRIVHGLGTLYTWNVWSPRVGVTSKLTGDGRTVLRASYGIFRQGLLTGEFSGIHPGATPTTTAAFDSATGGYTTLVKVDDPRINLQIDPETRPPRTAEYSVGVDREVGRGFAVAIAYVGKKGSDVIGWSDVGGQYREATRTLPDSRTVTVFELANSQAARRFLLSNQDGYSLTYNGLVMAAEKRRSDGWQASVTYTVSRVSGLQASSGSAAAGAQVSSVGGAAQLTFGQDPNSLTNARGRLANDRPHMLRVMGSVDIPRTGLVAGAGFQHFSGKPYAASAQLTLSQGSQRVLLEPPGSRRLASQSLLNLRLSKTIAIGGLARIELLVDVLNALDDTAEEGLATDNLFSPNFAQGTVFMDPRRAMVGVKLNLGR